MIIKTQIFTRVIGFLLFMIISFTLVQSNLIVRAPKELVKRISNLSF